MQGVLEGMKREPVTVENAQPVSVPIDPSARIKKKKGKIFATKVFNQVTLGYHVESHRPSKYHRRKEN